MAQPVATQSQPRQVLLVECPDRRGLVHDITGVLLPVDGGYVAK